MPGEKPDRFVLEEDLVCQGYKNILGSDYYLKRFDGGWIVYRRVEDDLFMLDEIDRRDHGIDKSGRG